MRKLILIALILALPACKDSKGGEAAKPTDLSGVNAQLAAHDSRIASLGEQVNELKTAQGTYNELLSGVARAEDVDALIDLLAGLESSVTDLSARVATLENPIVDPEAADMVCSETSWIVGGHMRSPDGSFQNARLVLADVYRVMEPGGFWSSEAWVEVQDIYNGNVLYEAAGVSRWMLMPETISDLTQGMYTAVCVEVTP